jgi:hypothetical protein
MAGDNSALIIDQDRTRETESLQAVRDLADLMLRVIASS